jgi:hypothetical protein
MYVFVLIVLWRTIAGGTFILIHLWCTWLVRALITVQSCLLKLAKESQPVVHGRQLRYEIFWERDPAMKELIDTSWRELGPLGDLGSVSAGLKVMMRKLHAWGRKKFGNVTRELNRMREKLKNLYENNAPRSEIRATSDLMNDLLYKEEMLWLQRSRIDWLKEGGRNIKFFHQKAVWRARKNKIKRLKDADGVWQEVPSDMERMATSYFKELFTRDPNLNFDELLGLLQERVTGDMNDSLCKEFSEEEIGDALFQIGPLKAPGIDGFPARFYQRNWDTMKAEVVNAVRLFFLTGQMPEEVNDTAIVFNP